MQKTITIPLIDNQPVFIECGHTYNSCLESKLKISVTSNGDYKEDSFYIWFKNKKIRFVPLSVWLEKQSK